MECLSGLVRSTLFHDLSVQRGVALCLPWPLQFRVLLDHFGSKLASSLGDTISGRPEARTTVHRVRREMQRSCPAPPAL